MWSVLRQLPASSSPRPKCCAGGGLRLHAASTVGAPQRCGRRIWHMRLLWIGGVVLKHVFRVARSVIGACTFSTLGWILVCSGKNKISAKHWRPHSGDLGRFEPSWNSFQPKYHTAKHVGKKRALRIICAAHKKPLMANRLNVENVHPNSLPRLFYNSVPLPMLGLPI